MTRLLAGILAVALISTIGDYIANETGVPYGIGAAALHGAVLLTAVAVALGAVHGRGIAALPAGVASGAAAALLFYLLTPVLGRWGLAVAWLALWLVLSAIDGVLIRRPPRALAPALLQGASAGLLSGVTFYLVIGGLWGPAPPGGRSYIIQFAMWCIAWAPGILAVGQDLRRRAAPVQ